MVAPADQVSPITDALVTKGLFASETGAAGFVSMIPPLPSFDTSEELTIFVATTFAYTLEPQGKLKGEDLRVAIGIVHDKAETTEGLDPLQLPSSVV